MGDNDKLLKELTEANGVPGYKASFRAEVRNFMDGLGEISQDTLPEA
jgi:putative aminopeptidase FrvX